MTTKNNNKLGEQAIYDVRSISFGKKFLLGLQHTFAMFGATVLVPIITGLDVSVTLLMAGLGTLLFHLVTGFKVPVFLGSSFAFLAGYAAIAPDRDPAHLSMALGGVFVAGIIYLIAAGFIRSFGVRRVMRFFPPVVTGPIVICIGLTLAPVAIKMANNNWYLALLAIAIVVIANIFGKGMIKIMPILLGIVISYLVALATGHVDTAKIAGSSLIGLPLKTEYFATFNISAIIVIVPIALATMMEHIGDMSAVSATTGKNYLANPGLHRTLSGDGLATMLASFFGGPANTTYGENTGVLVLTKVYDPRVTRYAAMFAIVFAFIPVIATVVNTIPVAVIGGISLILYGMIASIGVRNVVENRVDLTKSRNLIVASSVLVTGLGFTFSGVNVEFMVFGVMIKLSGIAVAAACGIFLNAVLPGKDFVFNMAEPEEAAAFNLSGVDTTEEGRHYQEVEQRIKQAEQIPDYTVVDSQAHELEEEQEAKIEAKLDDKK